MSFIHLDKSIITFHFKEILEDGHWGGPLTLFGLGALVIGPKLLASGSTTRRPTAQKQRVSSSPYRPHMSLSAWVATQAAQQKTSSHLGEAHDQSAMPLHVLSEQKEDVAA